MTAPDLGDSFYAWVGVIVSFITAVTVGIYKAVQRMSVVEVSPGSTNTTNGKSVTFDARLIQGIHDNVKILADLAIAEKARREQEARDKLIMERLYRMQERKRRRGEDDDDSGDNDDGRDRRHNQPRRR